MNPTQREKLKTYFRQAYRALDDFEQYVDHNFRYRNCHTATPAVALLLSFHQCRVLWRDGQAKQRSQLWLAQNKQQPATLLEAAAYARVAPQQIDLVSELMTEIRNEETKAKAPAAVIKWIENDFRQAMLSDALIDEHAAMLKTGHDAGDDLRRILRLAITGTVLDIAGLEVSARVAQAMQEKNKPTPQSGP